MNYQYQAQPQPPIWLSPRCQAGLIILGIIFLVLILTGAILAVVAAAWFICTLPFAVLADATLRIFWLCVLGVVVWQVVRVIRPFLPFRWR